MVPHLAETHTEELVQLCSACWDPGQAYNRINLMQLVGCYKSAKQRKVSQLYFVSHTTVKNFSKHIHSKMISKSSGNLNTNKTHPQPELDSKTQKYTSPFTTCAII